MEDCLFCKIAAGQVPSNKLYEDDQLLAFYDIDPQAPIHFLVIPKKHIPSAAALTEEDGALLGHIFATIAKLCADLGCTGGYPLVSQVGGDAGPSGQHPPLPVMAKRPPGGPARGDRGRRGVITNG